jgi:hypothetical protein
VYCGCADKDIAEVLRGRMNHKRARTFLRLLKYRLDIRTKGKRPEPAPEPEPEALRTSRAHRAATLTTTALLMHALIPDCRAAASSTPT